MLQEVYYGKIRNGTLVIKKGNNVDTGSGIEQQSHRECRMNKSPQIGQCFPIETHTHTHIEKKEKSSSKIGDKYFPYYAQSTVVGIIRLYIYSKHYGK